MNLLPKRLDARIAIVLCFLVVLFAAVQWFVLYRYWLSSADEFEQTLHWGVASEIADLLRDDLSKGYDRDFLLEKLYYFQEINPRFEIALLDENGQLFDDTTQLVIPRSEIDAFLTPNPYRKLPVYARSPVNPARRTVYSVAPVRVGEVPAYVYVSLQGGRFSSLRKGLIDRVLVFGGGVLSLVLVVVVSVVGIVFSIMLTRRFRRLTDAVHSFAGGTLDTRVSIRGDDEVSKLGEEFNQMADTIVENIDTLKRTDSQRREMVALITHDLGTPLASAQGYLETLTESDISVEPAEQQSYIEKALRGVRTVSRMLREFFELSKLDAPGVKTHIDEFSLDESLLEEIIPSLEPLARDRSVTLHTEIPENLGKVVGDIELIERVLSNLVENSIRYNKQGGRVDIRCERTAEEVKIIISDTGRGISEQDLPLIFERFFRTDDAQKNECDGTGLGLAIVKKILDVHDREILVESTLGEGSTFSFTLPLSTN